MKWHDIAQAIGQKTNVEDFRLSGISTDTRSLQAGEVFLALKGPHFNGHDFLSVAEQKGASGLIVSEAVNSQLPCFAVPDTTEAYGQIAHHWRVAHWDGCLIGITGSVGKTTMKHMITAILLQSTCVHSSPKNYNNAVGTPYTLLRLQPEHTHAVIEMGSSAPGEIPYLAAMAQPDVSIVTACAPVHIQAYPDGLDGIAHEKAGMYRALSKQGIAVLNVDDAYAQHWLEHDIGTRETWTYGFSPEADVFASDLQVGTQSSTCTVHMRGQSAPLYVPLAGKHNVLNALGAIAVGCCALGKPLHQAIKGIGTLAPYDGRLCFRPGPQGSRIIDDSYSANPRAVTAALEILAQQRGEKLFVFGDMGELGDYAQQAHREVGEQAKRLGIDKLLTYGKLSALAAQAFGAQAVAYETQEALIAALRPHLKEGVVCLVKGSNSMKMMNIVTELVEE